MTDKIVFSAIIIIVIGLLILAVYGSIEEQKSWDQFAAEHGCVEVGEVQSSTSTGVGPNLGSEGGVSVVFITTPGKIGYECDDGKTYWRNK